MLNNQKHLQLMKELDFILVKKNLYVVIIYVLTVAKQQRKINTRLFSSNMLCWKNAGRKIKL